MYFDLYFSFLQNKVESLSEELKRKSEFEEGLQSMVCVCVCSWFACHL